MKTRNGRRCIGIAAGAVATALCLSALLRFPADAGKQQHGLSPVLFREHVVASLPAAYQCAVADINGDGRPDIVCCGSATANVKWYENLGPPR